MKARKKPVVIEAIKWDGSNLYEVETFLGKAYKGVKVLNDAAWQVGKGIPIAEISIKTIDSIAKAINGDYVLKGTEGEFYPCKPDIFEKTYEIIED